jgi:cytochrome P450
MSEQGEFPRFIFRPSPSGVIDMLRYAVSDTARVIPEAILAERAVQLPLPAAPLVVSDPKLAHQVLVDREGAFTRDRFMRRLMRRSWGKGLAAAEGEDWQRQRRAAAPAFRPQAVAANLEKFALAAAKAGDQWSLGREVELTATIAPIIADIVFSVLVNDGGLADPAAVARDIPSYIKRISKFSMMDLLPLPEGWFDRLRGIPSDPVVQRLGALAVQIAKARESEPGGDDLIALLHGVGPIADNIGGLFPAAMDTTVSAASWTLYCLALSPEWQERVAEEALSCDGHLTLDRLPITRRVAQEVMRLYPPAPLVVRSARADMELGGFKVRKGQPVTVSIYAMHRHKSVWENPGDFDPDRFLPDRNVPSAYMPFGSGPRVCIAAQFALAEVMIVVARLLADFRMVPAGPEPQVTLQMTTRSANGLHVVATRR